MATDKASTSTSTTVDSLINNLPKALGFPVPHQNYKEVGVIVQVKKEVSVALLIEAGHNFLHRAQKAKELGKGFPTISFSTRFSKYSYEYDRLILKFNIVSIKGLQIEQFLHHLRRIIYLWENELFMSKRGLFYTTNTSLFKEQRKSDDMLQTIALLLDCSLDCIPVYAESTGRVLGDLSLVYMGKEVDFIDYNTVDYSGRPIPTLVDKITDIQIGTLGLADFPSDVVAYWWRRLGDLS